MKFLQNVSLKKNSKHHCHFRRHYLLFKTASFLSKGISYIDREDVMPTLLFPILGVA